jgi:PocR sensory domain-containing protein
MPEAAADNPTDVLGTSAGLRELLDATSLEDVLSSFYTLFQIPVRILDEEGRALAKTRKQPALNDYLAELPAVARRLGEVYELLRQQEPGEDGQFTLTCFTGATYHVASIAHDGRRVGRIVLGPFQTSHSGELSKGLLECAPDLDVPRTKELFAALPRVREDTMRAISRHLGVLLDALMFAGHKAWLTESMHLSAVQESFRELADKAELLQQAEQRITQLDQSRASFLAAVADDLSVRLAEASAEQLREMAAQLADLARLERGSLGLAMVQTNPSELLTELQAELRARRPSASVELALPRGGALPLLVADARRLCQALRFLAEDATGQVASALRLEASRRESLADSAQSGAWVLFAAPLPAVLEVRVIHLRLPVAELERDLPGRVQLARALAARIAEAHGGGLSVEDHPPAGAAFVLTLPLDSARSTPA